MGIRIAGSFGRGRAQKGFNVIARKEYGKGSMEYPFFENRPYTEYKAVVLRAGAQDQNRSKIRDELASGLLEGTDINILYQAYRPTVLYLNGEYWGVYFMKEKRNRFFVAQHENTENNVDLAIGKGFKQRSYGDNSDWVSLYEYATSHDLSASDAYNYVAERMDVDSFRDYMIAEIYNGNTDTYNFQYYRLKGGKWKFIFYDFCWGFQSPGHETLGLPHGQDAQRRMLCKAVCRHAPEQGLEGQLLPPLRGASQHRICPGAGNRAHRRALRLCGAGDKAGAGKVQ